jgi:hypothetical protein
MIECTCEHWPDYSKDERHEVSCPYNVIEQGPYGVEYV